jgi:hypothetical protein
MSAEPPLSRPIAGHTNVSNLAPGGVLVNSDQANIW